MINLGAFTPCGDMPPYITFNRDATDGSVTVDVRSAAVMANDGYRPILTYGSSAHIRLSAAEWSKLLAEMVRRSLEAP